jgi:hypothetical protein
MERSLDSYSSIKDVTYRFDAYAIRFSLSFSLPLLNFLLLLPACWIKTFGIHPSLILSGKYGIFH